jgi:tetratricopeptide (TPR) repeat protein
VKAYDIRIWPVNEESVWRTVEIGDRQTLHQLGNVIREEFGLKGDHLYAFFMGEKPYSSRVAYGGPNADTRRQANKTTIGSLGLKKGRKFLFLFNFTEDRSYQLLVQRILSAPDNAVLPRVSVRTGKLPAPPRPAAADANSLGPLRPLADRLQSVADAWSQGKRPSKAALLEEVALARTFDEKVAGRWQKIRSLERETGSDISGWLVGLPEALVAEGLADEALDIIDRFAGLEHISFLSDKPLVFLKAGRTEEAKQEAEANTRRFPEDAWVWAKAGNLLWQAGDAGKAERLLRRALEIAGSAQYLRESILERLLSLLEETGKTQAARDLAEAENRRRARNERS